jgi:hypothetical protein
VISIASLDDFKQKDPQARALGALRMRAFLAPEIAETVEDVPYTDEFYEVLEKAYAPKVDSGTL